MAQHDDIEQMLDDLAKTEVGAPNSPLSFVSVQNRRTKKTTVVAVFTSFFTKKDVEDFARKLARDEHLHVMAEDSTGVLWDNFPEQD